MSDHTLYLCFAPKYPDGAPAKNTRFRVAPPHFGAKLQSFAIDLPCSCRPDIRGLAAVIRYRSALHLPR